MQNFIPFFEENDDLVYCTNTENVLLCLGVQAYSPAEWRLFLGSSKRSLKCVLLHNTNNYDSMPIGHSTVLKEKYNTIKQVMEHVNYSRYKWVLCVDLKMVTFLLSQQSCYTKHPCFLCMWDSRAKEEHYTRKEWPFLELKVGEKNVINEALVPRNKIIFPPLHIRLGLMKQFVKALNKEDDCFKYICKSFPGLKVEKLKTGVFDGLDIRKLIKDADFVNSMEDLKKSTRSSFGKKLLGEQQGSQLWRFDWKDVEMLPWNRCQHEY